MDVILWIFEEMIAGGDHLSSEGQGWSGTRMKESVWSLTYKGGREMNEALTEKCQKGRSDGE